MNVRRFFVKLFRRISVTASTDCYNLDCTELVGCAIIAPMNKSECFVGQIVNFTCNGRDSRGGRGGHYAVRAVVTKVNRKNAELTEVKGTYRPGALWIWPIEDLRTEAQDREHHQCLLGELRAAHPDLFSNLKVQNV